VPAEFHGTAVTEVIVVEGRAAAASVQAAAPSVEVLALQGKLPNANKTPLAKLMRNPQIAKLNSCLTNAAEKRVKLFFDPDVDGQHCAWLTHAAISVLAPKYLTDGLVDVIRAPIYEIECADGGQKTRWLYDAAELQGFIRSAAGENTTVRHYKSIASMPAAMIRLLLKD